MIFSRVVICNLFPAFSIELVVFLVVSKIVGPNGSSCLILILRIIFPPYSINGEILLEVWRVSMIGSFLGATTTILWRVLIHLRWDVLTSSESKKLLLCVLLPTLTLYFVSPGIIKMESLSMTCFSSPIIIMDPLYNWIVSGILDVLSCAITGRYKIWKIVVIYMNRIFNYIWNIW